MNPYNQIDIFKRISNLLITLSAELSIGFKILLALMLIDIFTGLIKSLWGASDKSSQGYLNSSVMWKGGAKKILTISIIEVATLIDLLIPSNEPSIKAATITYYIAVESLSILENVSACGLPIPDKIKIFLDCLKTQK